MAPLKAGWRATAHLGVRGSGTTHFIMAVDHKRAMQGRPGVRIGLGRRSAPRGLSAKGCCLCCCTRQLQAAAVVSRSEYTSQAGESEKRMKFCIRAAHRVRLQVGLPIRPPPGRGMGGPPLACMSAPNSLISPSFLLPFGFIDSCRWIAFVGRHEHRCRRDRHRR